jgi:hypothetical protein
VQTTAKANYLAFFFLVLFVAACGNDPGVSTQKDSVADLAVLDRNILSLSETASVESIIGIVETQVDMTVFDGRVIFERDQAN